MKWLRTRENAAFAKGLMMGKAVGAKDERERIIKLLEGDAGQQIMCLDCSQELIALIKGENK